MIFLKNSFKNIKKFKSISLIKLNFFFFYHYYYTIIKNNKKDAYFKKNKNYTLFIYESTILTYKFNNKLVSIYKSYKRLNNLLKAPILKKSFKIFKKKKKNLSKLINFFKKKKNFEYNNINFKLKYNIKNIFK